MHKKQERHGGCEHERGKKTVQPAVPEASPHGMLYVCPMHPEVVRKHPGMCPECGMSLVPGADTRASSREHDKHTGRTTSSFLRKFWIALVLTVPIFFYSEMARMLFGIQGPAFLGSSYVLLALGSIVFFYCGLIFITSAYRELYARLPGMMTLIAIAITAAYVYSAASILLGEGHDLLFELASLIAVMLLGHWIEIRAVKGAHGALKELSKLLPDVAEVVRGERTATVPISELVIGDTVLVRPGAKVPADGRIVSGTSDLNESIITGESKPISKSRGDEVIAGSLNGDGSLKIEVTKIGEGTFLAGVMRLVAEAETSKSRLQILSDRAAFYLTIVAIVSGGLTFTLWLLADSGIVFATERMVAVLVIACPHALGLAVPLVASISTTMAARNGLLIRRRLALESARKIDVVLFDKTGTLTEAKFKLMSVSSDETLVLAASINAHSEHAIGKAIVEEASRRGLSLKEATGFKRIAGRGAEAHVGGARVFVGTHGGDDIVVEKDGKQIGTVEVADAIRPESYAAIQALKDAGIKVAMITGDSEATARSVARELRLDEYFARVLPEEKVQKVRDLQTRGFKVAMVGDGVNDAPALTQADLGIAIGAGTNVAIESAGIILVKNDPRDIAKIISLSKLTFTKMIQNLFWATGYNLIAIPLAAGALALWGVMLQPAVAAIFMSLSTVVVAINAALLRRHTL